MSEMSLALWSCPHLHRTADSAKVLKGMGESAEKASVRAFKEKVFIANGAFCCARWKL